MTPARNKKNTKVLIISIIILLAIPLSCILLGLSPNDNSDVEVDRDGDTYSENTDPENTETVKGIAEVEINTYEVLSVADGDTLHIEIDRIDKTVRLVGIDTPELSHPEKPVECFAKEAKDKLVELVEGKEVRIEYDGEQGNQDKYGRELLYIWSDDLFINDYMVREGYAYAYREIESDYLDQFIEAEEEAKVNQRGMWGDVCKCTKGEEESRDCIDCNKAEAHYYNWDCTTYTAEVDDSSCSYLCPKEDPVIPPPVQTWVCDCKKTCPQMSSCAEAQYQLNVCGCKARDNDKDGIACDSDCQ